MKNLHRISGIIVSIFITAHLFNHSMAWFGIETHQKILELFRTIYQNPIIEVILICVFIFQSISGFRLFFLLRKRKNNSFNDKLKMYSGLILGLFIMQHLTATIGQRLIFEMDTNFYFAARVVIQKPFVYYFVPYYFLGIMSFATHLASIHQSKIIAKIGQQKAHFHFKIILIFFFCLAIFILYIFMGYHFSVAIPEVYNVY